MALQTTTSHQHRLHTIPSTRLQDTHTWPPTIHTSQWFQHNMQTRTFTHTTIHLTHTTTHQSLLQNLTWKINSITIRNTHVVLMAVTCQQMFLISMLEIITLAQNIMCQQMLTTEISTQQMMSSSPAKMLFSITAQTGKGQCHQTTIKWTCHR